jgi:type VI secretion system protein
MDEETLLERIRHLGEKTALRSVRDVTGGLRSVIRNLQNILNTRQGSVLIADDYGMPDFTNFPVDDLSKTATEMERIIGDMIQKYEPRLRQVRVHFDPKPDDRHGLRFRLEGEMTDPLNRNRVVPVGLETVVTTEGKVRVDT